MAASIRTFRVRPGPWTKRICYVFTGVMNKCKRKISSESHNYCLNILRKHDYENFLCLLQLPHQALASAVAVRAFNAEIAGIKDSVSEKTIGQMRFRFWKDSIENIYKSRPPNHPIAIELSRAVESHKLSKRWFNRVLEAREETIDDRPFQTLESAEEHAENTSSSILYLILESLGVQDLHADHAASHIGRAQGLVTLLRSVPFHAQRRNVLLPMEITSKHKVSQEDLIRGKMEQPAKDVMFEIASRANAHLETARSFRKDVPKEALPAFLVTLPMHDFLTAIQKVDFDVFDPKLQRRNHMLPVRLWLQHKRKTY
ncbi:NADH dehydrogenase (ubiquinone) complex I, assembly factor 6-like [Antedon mediterranea]|uniref:NADH dehydrogenase (ubiquinone) complex I, assembly factor 6-like n=1 Tax=Antedon mediterranea TaxID=105859 RepID=UPI003AF6F64A